MSWTAYTDSLIAQGATKGAAIVGYPDGGLWAASGDCALQGTEGATMCARFATPLSGAGLMVGGTKYMATQCDADCLTGKKGQSGVVVVKSGKACIIAVYGDGMTAGNCRLHASNMAQDLVSKGF